MSGGGENGSGRGQGKRGDASREAILRAALNVVGRDGLPTASLAAIAREAGISKPAVLYHFGSRLQLLRAMTVRALDRLRAELERRCDPPDAGARTVEFLFSPEQRTLLSAVRELMGIGSRDPVVAETVRKALDELQSHLAARLSGRVANRDELAHDLVVSIHGVVSIWLSTGAGDPGPFREAAARICQRLSAGASPA